MLVQPFNHLKVCPSICVTRFRILYISWESAQEIELKLGGYIHYGTLQILVTFGEALLNS